MSLRIATGTDGSVKERKGLKRKFKAYAGLAFGLILIAGLFAGCGKKDTADADILRCRLKYIRLFWVVICLYTADYISYWK